MIVFKYFWKILAKQSSGAMLFFGIFIALTIIFTQVGGTANFDFENTAIPLAIIDEDNSQLSRELTDYLGEQHTLVDVENDELAMQQALLFFEVSYILVIPDGFEESFLLDDGKVRLGNAQSPNTSEAFYLDNQIDIFLTTLKAYYQAEFPLTEAIAYAREDVAQGVDVTILSGEVGERTPMYFQFMPYALLSVIAVLIAPIFLTFNKKDIAKRIESSALTLRERNMQLALGCTLTALGVWAIFNVIPFILYRDEIHYATSSLRMINSLALTFVSVGLAFLLGQVVKNNNVLAGAVNVIIMGMSFLTGIFVPQEVLGEGVLMFARFLPTYWYVRSNGVISTTTEINMRVFWEGTFMQLGFAIVLLGVALVIMRRRKMKGAV